MNDKIKFLRTTLNLSEKEIASLLNISAYKYSSFEKKGIKIPCDILIMLSKIYGINIKLLLEPIYDKQTILIELEKQNLFDTENKSQTLKILNYNLFTKKNIKISYHSIKKIKNDFRQNIINFIEDSIKASSSNIQEFAASLNIDENSLSSVLSGKKFIDTLELIKLSKYSKTDINNIINYN